MRRRVIRRPRKARDDYGRSAATNIKESKTLVRETKARIIGAAKAYAYGDATNKRDVSATLKKAVSLLNKVYGLLKNAADDIEITD